MSLLREISFETSNLRTIISSLQMILITMCIIYARSLQMFNDIVSQLIRRKLIRITSLASQILQLVATNSFNKRFSKTSSICSFSTYIEFTLKMMFVLDDTWLHLSSSELSFMSSLSSHLLCLQARWWRANKSWRRSCESNKRMLINNKEISSLND